MRRKRQVQCFLRIIPAAVLAAGISGFAVAETLKAAPEQPLQAMVDLAQDGDIRVYTRARSGSSVAWY